MGLLELRHLVVGERLVVEAFGIALVDHGVAVVDYPIVEHEALRQVLMVFGGSARP